MPTMSQVVLEAVPLRNIYQESTAASAGSSGAQPETTHLAIRVSCPVRQKLEGPWSLGSRLRWGPPVVW